MDAKKLGIHTAELMENLPEFENGEITSVMTVVAIRYGEEHENFYCHLATTPMGFPERIGLVETARIAILQSTPFHSGPPPDGS